MKLKSFIILAFLTFGLTFMAVPTTFAFSDVTGSAHEQDILSLSQKGLVSGYTDGTYRPNTPLTREQAVRLIGRILVQEQYKIPEDAQEITRFDDISSSADMELKNLSAMLYEEEVFVGAQGNLDLNMFMQRQHMAIVLNRVAQDFYRIDLQHFVEEGGYKSTFADLDGLSKETINAITNLQYAGITIGERFNPTHAVTRGEFATFLNRLLTYAEKIQQEQVESNQEVDTTTGDSSQIDVESNKNENASSDETGTSLTSAELKGVNSIQISLGTPLYASRNALKQIGTWETQYVNVLATYLEEDHLFVITMGDEKYYVKPEAVTPQKEFNEKLENTLGVVRTNSSYSIWNNTLDVKLLAATRPTKLKVIEIVGDYYRVQIGGQAGFIHRNETYVNAQKPLKLLETKSPINLQTGMSNFTLSKGAVIKASGDNAYSYFFGGNGETHYIDKRGVVETDELESLIPTVYTMYPVKLVAKTNAPIYNAQGVMVGELPANVTVTLTGLAHGKGVIDFIGQSTYVNLSDFKHIDLVNSNKSISYAEVEYYLNVLHHLYPHFTELELIGQSVEGRNIHALKIGTGSKLILMDASTHAREHMTTNVLMEMMDQYSLAYLTGSMIGNYNVNQTLSNVAIWFVPMVNPDGVTLVQGGPTTVANTELVKQINGYSGDFGRWKANVRGVDINRNFDARWAGLAKGSPSWDMYKGPTPFSEPETVALGQFMLKYPFKTNLAIHSSGQVIYWGHNDQNKDRNTNLARLIGNVTGHALIKSSQTGPTGASASYFSKMTGNPSMTVEIAPYAGDAPVPQWRWPDVWKRTHLIGLAAAAEASNR